MRTRNNIHSFMIDVSNMEVVFVTSQPVFGNELQPFQRLYTSVNWIDILNANGYDPEVNYFSPLYRRLTGTAPLNAGAWYNGNSIVKRRWP